jgi:hypothetical protein
MCASSASRCRRQPLSEAAIDRLQRAVVDIAAERELVERGIDLALLGRTPAGRERMLEVAAEYGVTSDGAS